MRLEATTSGDILIHCGDFSKRLRESEYLEKLDDFNEFLESLPHRHKVFVAGNHEIAFNNHTHTEIAGRLTSCYYLQDSAISIEGLKIYGTPWTNSANMGFSASHEQLKSKWDSIPSDTDILITHMPPFNILDLAFQHGAPADLCKHCGQIHRNYAHWGDVNLRAKVTSIKPKVHLFGHVHDAHGCLQLDRTLFVNASQDISFKPVFFDYIYEGRDKPTGVSFLSSPSTAASSTVDGGGGDDGDEFWLMPTDTRARGTRVHEVASPLSRQPKPPLATASTAASLRTKPIVMRPSAAASAASKPSPTAPAAPATTPEATPATTPAAPPPTEPPATQPVSSCCVVS